jgi:hypothetical protein
MKSEEKSVIGIVSFASGETLAYTDPAIFLQVIRTSCHTSPTSGFQYEVLTDDPAVRKARTISSTICSARKIPRPLEDYGLTEQGREALKNAENPNLPHSYRWFVVENFAARVKHGMTPIPSPGQSTASTALPATVSACASPRMTSPPSIWQSPRTGKRIWTRVGGTIPDSPQTAPYRKRRARLQSSASPGWNRPARL